MQCYLVSVLVERAGLPNMTSIFHVTSPDEDEARDKAQVLGSQLWGGETMVVYSEYQHEAVAHRHERD